MDESSRCVVLCLHACLCSGCKGKKKTLESPGLGLQSLACSWEYNQHSELLSRLPNPDKTLKA
ncbi:rCG57144 [Rattus norvegicus]|uniref:RCG57144 n=1 Tax=Rattus norvegicus TaxID=10116 RepID=A6JDG8_RAT|nr:rCG57144 [Rattus norvegicus]